MGLCVVGHVLNAMLVEHDKQVKEEEKRNAKDKDARERGLRRPFEAKYRRRQQMKVWWV